MTLEENIIKIINKLKHNDMEHGQIKKEQGTIKERIETLEKRDFPESMKILSELKERLEALENKPCFEGEAGGFLPNEKFIKWYREVFAEDTKEEVEEILEEAVIAEEEVSPEVLEELEEVANNAQTS